jgi:hypothetical protein
MANADAVENFDLRFETLQKGLLASAQMQGLTLRALAKTKDLLLQFQTMQLQERHPNPLNKFGQKCFSQTDEDGITLEIVRRLGIENGVYAEFGVGNGLENNTLILAALGWRGFWVGGEDLAFDHSRASRFHYIKSWITLDNISAGAFSGLQAVGAGHADVVSLDLDGNDIYFVEELLSKGVCPKLFIVEYNAKFIPPVRFQIAYDPRHEWAGDDYFGAALVNFSEMFAKHGYKLVCCNSHSGANAFFVRTEFEDLFEDVPKDIRDIWVPPRYHLYEAFGHRKSARVVEAILNS